MNEETNISVSDLAAVLGLDPKSTKSDVLARLSSNLANQQPGGKGKRWKLSKVFKNREHFDQLARQPVRVRVRVNQPISERGAVYYPEERNQRGQVTKPADVFITDRARLQKIAWAVAEVSDGTPTTAELAAKEAKAA